MISFRKRTLLESALHLWPPYRRKSEERLRQAIIHLVDHPEEACKIGGDIVLSGFGQSVPVKED